MKRFLKWATAFAVTMGLVASGLAACAGPDVQNAVKRPAPAVTAPTVRPGSVVPASMTSAMHVSSKVAAMKVGPLTRSWVVFTPARSLPKSAPIIVELSGIGNTVSVESSRNRLLPYVEADRAELIYPVAINQSWDVGGCCGAAGKLKINDVAFLEKLVPAVDPGHKRPIYFVGYSNGGRMVYDLECTDPGLFDAMAIMKADPMPGCVVTKPQNVLVVSALDDPWVPYKPGGEGRETPPATVQIARLQSDLGCPSKSTSATHGDMTLTTWSSCTDGKRLVWAVYATGGHNWPPPTAHTPSGSAIIWSFFTQAALAPLPTT
jgi:polyhydroxybutyrate depolymerase